MCNKMSSSLHPGPLYMILPWQPWLDDRTLTLCLQAPPPVTISVIPASAGLAGNVAAAPKAARPRAAGGTSKLKKLVGSTSGRAGAMASAARTGGVKPAKPAPHRAVPGFYPTPILNPLELFWFRNVIINTIQVFVSCSTHVQHAGELQTLA